MRRIPTSAFLYMSSLLLAAPAAHGSCGSAFCLVNTEWAAQGLGMEPGLSLDLRHEWIDLDQPRAGAGRVSVGEIPRHHDEVRTRNRNLVASLDWAASPSWAVSLSLPYVDREHEHIHNHRGEKLVERWSFRGMGDARVLARGVLANAEADGTLRSSGVSFGVKLPTGRHDVANGEGALAERTLQPGTGTTDAVVGAWTHSASATGWSWFARAEARAAVNERAGYRPGPSLQVDGGVRRSLGADVAFMLQGNGIVKGQDRGDEAEPEDSGQRALFVSPGLSWRPARGWSVYAFVQVPVWQWVRGVQLTAKRSAVLGTTLAF